MSHTELCPGWDEAHPRLLQKEDLWTHFSLGLIILFHLDIPWEPLLPFPADRPYLLGGLCPEMGSCCRITFGTRKMLLWEG